MKKIITLILALILCLSSLGLFGCAEESGGKAVLLSSFENFDRDIQPIHVLDGMGDVGENRDMQFVKGGKKSLYATPVGLTWVTKFPYLVIPTTSINYNMNYGNFENVEKVTCWVYNTSDETEWMSMGLTGLTRTHQYAESAIRPNGEYFVLAPGWNFIEYYIYPAYMSMQSFDIKSVYGIFFEFDRSEEITVASAIKFYIDEVKLHYVKGERKPITTLNLNSDAENGAWEVCDFEDSMQSYHFAIPYVIPSAIWNQPHIRTVNASKYNITAKSGVNVLEVIKRAGTNNFACCYMQMEGTALKEAFKNIGQDLIDNPSNYVLKFDIYNTSDVVDGFTIEIFSDRSYDETLNSDNSQTGTYFSSGTKVNPGEWYTYEKNIGSIDSNIKNRAAGSASTTDDDKTPVLFSQHPGGITFSWAAFRTSSNMEDRVILIDNFRIEKVS